MKKLDEALHLASALTRIYTSDDFQRYLKPHMEKLSVAQPISPQKYKTEEEYIFALKEANSRALMYKEFLTFLSQQEVVMNKIRLEIEKPKSYEV